MNRPTYRGTVDRRLAKAIAYKRTVTGAMSLVGAAVMVTIAVNRGEHAASMPIFGAAILVFAGAWALRDGVRLLRELG